jgi:hypothetical protein
MFCAPGATVIWTRGGTSRHDVTQDIRRWFEGAGFEEVAFDASPDEDHFRVGAHRLVAPPRALEPGLRLFTFLR